MPRPIIAIVPMAPIALRESRMILFSLLSFSLSFFFSISSDSLHFSRPFFPFLLVADYLSCYSDSPFSVFIVIFIYVYVFFLLLSFSLSFAFYS